MNKEEKNIINKLKRQSSIEELVENEGVTDTFILVSVFEAKTILNLINNQQKEIEELKRDRYLYNAKTREITKIKSNSISKDTIRDKIKDITEYYEKEIKPELYHWGYFTVEEHFADIIARYNELLEEK